MNAHIRNALLGAVLVLGQFASGALANDGQILRGAIEAARADNWTQAVGQARRASGNTSARIIEWMRLRDGQGRWTDYTNFLKTNGDWPGLRLLRKRAEAVMPSQLPAGQVRSFFAQTQPQTGRGALLLALATNGSERKKVLQTAWTTLDLSSQEQAQMLERFGRELAPYHWARLDHLLWEGEHTQARAMLPLVSGGQRALANARIILRKRANGVDAAIKAVPGNLQSDPGLAFERMVWRARAGRDREAASLMTSRSKSVKSLGRPEEWANRRRSLARSLLRQGHPRDAYALASQHRLKDGSDYADLEWLSGYIALTKLKDPKRAVTHFTRFRSAVFTPISLGRAGYWLGRAYEAQGNSARARSSYGLGASYQTSFYGQLAAERAGLPSDASIVRSSRLPDWRNSRFVRTGPMRAALTLQQAGEEQMMLRFMLHVNESLSREDSAALARLALELRETHAALRIAKAEAAKGQILAQAYYPVTSLAKSSGPVPPEVAMAIARQESELNPLAVSPAGARGLMQLMPGTAKKMSGALGIGYSLSGLTRDPAYNSRLGTAYLRQMLERYEGSYILMAVAYNAGPGRADRWIQEYGDPRSASVDPINWIENIPFRETRNYVMRVLEGMQVYRMRISGDVRQARISRDLTRP